MAQRDCRRRPTRANNSASSGWSVEAAGVAVLAGGAWPGSAAGGGSAAACPAIRGPNARMRTGRRLMVVGTLIDPVPDHLDFRGRQRRRIGRHPAAKDDAAPLDLVDEVAQ